MSPPRALTPLPRAQARAAAGLQRYCTYSRPESVDAARRLLHMCKAADLGNEPLYAGGALERALWRYEALWLPLLVAVDPALRARRVAHSPAFARTVEELRRMNEAKGGLGLRREECVPPLDVAWVWHCHRLCVKVYEADMDALVEGGADGALDCCYADAFVFSDGEDAQSKRVRALWGACYPDEPYMPAYIVHCSLEEDEAERRQRITSYVGEMGRAVWKSRVDLHAVRCSARAQKTFLWQVVGVEGMVPNGAATEDVCETNEWLGRAWDRYLMFLGLYKNRAVDGGGELSREDEMLVPMSDINVVWHAHLSCSREYKRDCVALLGYVLDHDIVGVEERRMRKTAAALAALARTEDGTGSSDGDGWVREDRGAAGGDPGSEMDDGAEGDESLGLPSVELAEMDESELKMLVEKRRRGLNLRGTKTMWEATYGQYPRYDLPDTLYRGEAEGERGGFYEVFVTKNGEAHDINWLLAFFLMLAATVVVLFGMCIVFWAFCRTMLGAARHGKYMMGVPVGGAVAVLGVYLFLKVPVNRPLSSTARYWRDRQLRQTHNPLPPYLISSTKKAL